MFGFKIVSQRHFESMEQHIFSQTMKINAYKSLLWKLKRFDWFEFNSGGGIVAHTKDEPNNGYAIYGTCFIVPDEMITIDFGI